MDIQRKIKELLEAGMLYGGNTPEEKLTWLIGELKTLSRVELPVMPNEVLDGGLTEEEQEFMEMIINWQMENPKAYERIKAFADISISRATLFSALADYASQREA